MEKSMTTEERHIKNRLELLHLSSYLKYVFEVCRAMGYSRDTFYRAKKAHEEGVLEGLREKSCYKEFWSHNTKLQDWQETSFTQIQQLTVSCIRRKEHPSPEKHLYRLPALDLTSYTGDHRFQKVVQYVC